MTAAGLILTIKFLFAISFILFILITGMILKNTLHKNLSPQFGKLFLLAASCIANFFLPGLPIINFNSIFTVIIGLCFLIMVQVFHAIALYQLGRNFKDDYSADKGSLIKSGVYSLVRHPIYTAFALYGLIFIIVSPKLLFFSLAVLAMPFQRIPKEEKDLESVYGSDYEQYRNTVQWRLIPFVY